MKSSGKQLVSEPIIRFRSLVLFFALLAALIAIPMLAVWKQAYINKTSIQLNNLSDSLVDLQKDVAKLQFVCERYSSPERIEKLAREALGLEYPVSSQIVILPIYEKHGSDAQSNFTREILAFFRKTIGKDKG